MAQAIHMIHDTDPKQAIQDAVGPYVHDIAVLGARVLVGVYVRPDKTRAGIILPDQTKGEDRYQGKVGLVLAVGPLAFQEDETHRWGAHVPKVGDWVVYSVGDTFAFELGKHRCRAVEDVDVHLIVKTPDSIL